MAEIMLNIGGRNHPIACADGDEPRVRQLGTMIDARWATAQRAAGGLSAERAMLFVALMLADEQRPPEGAAVSETALARIADRLESLAEALEQTPPSA
jgi:cell division protein ZapA